MQTRLDAGGVARHLLLAAELVERQSPSALGGGVAQLALGDRVVDDVFSTQDSACCALRGVGFAKNDDDGWWRPAAWMDRPWRPVWAGYTPEQRRLILATNKPAAVLHKGAGVSDGAL